MFGMGTGGSLRLLSPEILCCPFRLLAAVLASAFQLPRSQLLVRFTVCTFKTAQEKRLTTRIDVSVYSTSLTQLSDQALDRLVSTTFIRYRTSSVDLSTSSSLRGLTCF